MTEHRIRAQEVEGEQVVVLHKVLSEDANYGYNFSNMQLLRLNGTRVVNMAQLAALVDSAAGPYLEFVFTRGRTIVLQTDEAREATARVLEQHSIAEDRSANLKVE